MIPIMCSLHNDNGFEINQTLIASHYNTASMLFNLVFLRFCSVQYARKQTFYIVINNNNNNVAYADQTRVIVKSFTVNLFKRNYFTNTKEWAY